MIKSESSLITYKGTYMPATRYGFKQAHANYGFSNTVEPQIGEWWESAKSLVAYFEKHKHWPKHNDPIHGPFMTRINRAFKQAPINLSADKISFIRQSGYLEREHHSSASNKKGGAVERVITAYKEGITPDAKDVNRVRRKENDGQLGKKTTQTLTELGFQF